jgi:hypothetical protein
MMWIRLNDMCKTMVNIYNIVRISIESAEYWDTSNKIFIDGFCLVYSSAIDRDTDFKKIKLLIDGINK